MSLYLLVVHVKPFEPGIQCDCCGKRNFYKWKNHFSEMKGDVGMSVHKKEGEQEGA